MRQLQNFYKQTLPIAWAPGTGIRYVSVKPTPTEGWLVISPNNATLREIIEYSSTGTDGTGDYVVVSARGVGGTSDITHSIGEPIRMNLTAEYWADNNTELEAEIQQVQDNLDTAILAGAQYATTSLYGISKMSVAPVSPTAPISVGDNDPRVPTTVEKARIPSVDTSAALAGGGYLGTPSSTNKFITETGSTPIKITFTSSGTWTKPAGLKYIDVEIWGGGGGGSGGNDNGNDNGNGGGGGAYNYKRFLASELSTTETVTVGAGGAGGAGSGPGGSGTNGSVGGTTSFGTLLYAYGGGGGAIYFSSVVAGAGGGGQLSAGSDSAGGAPRTNTAGSPGYPMVGNGGYQIDNGAGGDINLSQKNGIWGGGAGGDPSIFLNGGNSTYGGGGGGSAVDGAAGVSVFGGNGGVGGNGASVPGGNGAIPAGGGGGGGYSTGSSAGGSGGRGEVRVTEYYS